MFPGGEPSSTILAIVLGSVLSIGSAYTARGKAFYRWLHANYSNFQITLFCLIVKNEINRHHTGPGLHVVRVRA